MLTWWNPDGTTYNTHQKTHDKMTQNKTSYETWYKMPEKSYQCGPLQVDLEIC